MHAQTVELGRQRKALTDMCDVVACSLPDTGTLAGLQVLRIINEPTAAALAYGIDRSSKYLQAPAPMCAYQVLTRVALAYVVVESCTLWSSTWAPQHSLPQR